MSWVWPRDICHLQHLSELRSAFQRSTPKCAPTSLRTATVSTTTHVAAIALWTANIFNAASGRAGWRGFDDSAVLGFIGHIPGRNYYRSDMAWPRGGFWKATDRKELLDSWHHWDRDRDNCGNSHNWRHRVRFVRLNCPNLFTFLEPGLILSFSVVSNLIPDKNGRSIRDNNGWSF